MIKYKFIDLFARCGGLEDGFLQSGMYIDVAAVEWLKPQVNTLISTNLKNKMANSRCLGSSNAFRYTKGRRTL